MRSVLPTVGPQLPSTRDPGDALHGRGMPLGVLGEPRASRARVAIRRPAFVAPGDDRAARGRQRPRRTRIRSGSSRARTPYVPGAVRHAVRARPEGAPRGYGSRVPRGRRCADPRAWKRVARSSGAAAREFHDPAPARRRRGDLSALRGVRDLDADAIIESLDRRDVSETYERDKAEARSAAGTAAESQRKTSTSDGPVRFTAPSIVFDRDAETLVAGGWQPTLAYDVLIANLEPGLERNPPPEGPETLLEHFADGLTTAEVAALLADGPDPTPDIEGTERTLLDLVVGGGSRRVPLGQDALWLST